MKQTSMLRRVMTVLMLSLVLPMVASADFYPNPTGHYYQYAGFTVGDGSGYLGGGDVDSYGDLIYVNRDGVNLDVYQVTLLDSDGDGLLEPDQHPLNIGADEIAGTEDDEIGPMEERVLTYLTSYYVPALDIPTTGEIYAVDDRVYFLGEDEGDIYEYVFATGVTSKVVDSPTFNLSQLGYDDVNGKWYASRESERRVYSWNGSNWVAEFDYASLAGSHMDGLDVITEPDTGIPYVYVSDMTSDYIGQWRYDAATSSWVEENLFAYAGTFGHVEGMGFNAIGHIWVTTGFANTGTLYELGGGKLSDYLPPIEMEVAVDIHPTSCPNPLNVGSKGTIPVAIVGTEDFPIDAIDPASIRLMGVAPVRSSLEDVATPFEPFLGKENELDCTTLGPDGYLDLTLKFDTQEVVAMLVELLGDVEDGDVIVLTLTGNLTEEFGGIPIVGEDVVRIVKKK